MIYTYTHTYIRDDFASLEFSSFFCPSRIVCLRLIRHFAKYTCAKRLAIQLILDDSISGIVILFCDTGAIFPCIIAGNVVENTCRIINFYSNCDRKRSDLIMLLNVCQLKRL